MRLAVVIWIALLSISQAYTPDICFKKSFGYKVADPKDRKSYFQCLGLLGKIWNHCDDGYRFSGPEQKCMLDKHLKAVGDGSSGPDNVFNINQNISMYKPIIFNIFGSLWRPSKPRPPLPEPTTPPITTESTTAPSSSSLAPDSTTESTSTSSTASSTESSSSSSTESSTESSSSSSTESSTESSSSSSTSSSTESSSSSSTASSTESSSSSSTTSSTESSSSSSTPCTLATEAS
ncbi:zinc finger CCHC domain-containing protein 10 isoform X3 [Drosophila mojavensis]|uniref:zinc finger CCHC domain-containing protein 10 isoform X3 n=1 Tax=Drosophila mojavensis TaxID=7230 RepID=UPI0013EED1F8|nr:zinc finger CCHC domain-containing protein 10 isoform X3 [Drosophila mojavensis]